LRIRAQEELVPLIDVVTTKRLTLSEPAHFNFLVEKALPDLTAHTRRKTARLERGCSSARTYTLALVLSEYGSASRVSLQNLATDISTHVLEKAELAVYASEWSACTGGLRRKYS